jgi:hypothetical protein
MSRGRSAYIEIRVLHEKGQSSLQRNFGQDTMQKIRSEDKTVKFKVLCAGESMLSLEVLQK